MYIYIPVLLCTSNYFLSYDSFLYKTTKLSIKKVVLSKIKLIKLFAVTKKKLTTFKNDIILLSKKNAL